MIILRQKEFSGRQEIDKDKEKLYQDMKKKYPGLYRNRDFVSHYKTLSQDEQKYISNRDADEFTDYILSQVNKKRNLDSDKTKDKDEDEEKLNKRKSSSKFRQVLDKINSIPKKKPIHRFGISSTDAALLHDQAQQQSWQAHVDAVNSHSLATMGMPIM